MNISLQTLTLSVPNANSFARAKLKENCELQGTDNVQGQINKYIFAQNIVFIVLQIFWTMQKKKCLQTAYCLLLGMFSFEYSLVRLNKKKYIFPFFFYNNHMTKTYRCGQEYRW